MTTKYRIVKIHEHRYEIQRLETKAVYNWWGKELDTKEEWTYLDWWYTIRCCERAIARGDYDDPKPVEVVREIER